MNRREFRFFDPLRVRWAEVDMQKIVFNAHYLTYFDTAVAAYWRALALPYHATMEALGGDLYVRKATLEYLGSARYEDRCDVGLRCERIGNSSMTLLAALFRGDRLLVHGELVYVFADPATQKSQPLPAALREVLQAYETGEAMSCVELQPWERAREGARRLRQAVFVDEEGLPELLVEDGDDARAWQAVALNRLGVAVACGRLLPLDGGRGKIGRMAADQAVRGAGLGREVLQGLLAEAARHGLREVVLDATTGAVPFYASAGFRCEGPVFLEAGREHQTMAFTLGR